MDEVEAGMGLNMEKVEAGMGIEYSASGLTGWSRRAARPRPSVWCMVYGAGCRVQGVWCRVEKAFLKWQALFHLRGRPGVPAPPLHPRVGPEGRRGARAAAPPSAARGRNPLLDETSGTLA